MRNYFKRLRAIFWKKVNALEIAPRGVGIRLAALVLIFPTGACATCIIVLRDLEHHRFILAADSLVKHRYGNRESSCKIIVEKTNNCIFMMAGMYSLQTPHFNLLETTRSACEVNGDTKAKADAFLQAVTPQMRAAVQYLWRTDSKYLLDTYADKTIVMVLFAGSSGDRAAVFARGVVLRSSDNKLAFQSDQVVDDKADTGFGFEGGVYQDISEYMNKHPKWASEPDKIALARKFVRLQSDATPDLVGGPISILTIDDLGRHTWIQRGVCPQD